MTRISALSTLTLLACASACSRGDLPVMTVSPGPTAAAPATPESPGPTAAAPATPEPPEPPEAFGPVAGLYERFRDQGCDPVAGNVNTELEARLLMLTPYAIAGRVFNDPALDRFFSNEAWYRPGAGRGGIWPNETALATADQRCVERLARHRASLEKRNGPLPAELETALILSYTAFLDLREMATNGFDRARRPARLRPRLARKIGGDWIWELTVVGESEVLSLRCTPIDELWDCDLAGERAIEPHRLYSSVQKVVRVRADGADRIATIDLGAASAVSYSWTARWLNADYSDRMIGKIVAIDEQTCDVKFRVMSEPIQVGDKVRLYQIYLGAVPN